MIQIKERQFYVIRILAIFFALASLIFFSQALTTKAANFAANGIYPCKVHGFHDKAYCPPVGGAVTATNFGGGIFDNYQANIEFLGHRHGSSEITAIACFTKYDGSQGPCKSFSGKGDQLGREYGGYVSNPLQIYPGSWGGNGGGGTISISNTTEPWELIVGSYVEDAEVYIDWSASAFDNDEPPPPPPPPPPPVSQVNLNFIVKNQSSEPIVGALVTINQNFGNVTTRNTDGNGFANFGVSQNTSIGWSVSTSNCGSTSGTENVGISDATVNVPLNCSVGAPPPPPGSTTKTLTVKINGSGSVTDGTDTCYSGSCPKVYKTDTTVTLTANPASGWKFDSWGGDCAGQPNPCSGIMSVDRNVTANFTVIPVIPGPGTCTDGIKNGDETGIDTGGRCDTTPTCQDPNATNYGGALPCVFPPTSITGNITCNGQTGSCNIQAGGSATYVWSSSNATNCNVLPYDPAQGYTGANDTKTDPAPATRRVDLDCWNATSSGVVKSVQVNVGVPPPPPPPPGASSATASCTVAVQARPGPSVLITANPNNLSWNNSGSTLNWSSSNADSCSASGNWSGAKALSDSQGTGVLAVGTYNYTLTCSGNGSAQSTATVTVNPPVPVAYSATYSDPNYCLSGPGGFISWSYSDPANSPQASYEVQVTDTGNFNNPLYDSGKLNSSSKEFAIPNGILQFNTTYKARVRVWNSLGGISEWSDSTNSWKTPPYAYPQVDFSWIANGILNNPSPPLNKPVQFTDQTVFSDGKKDKNHEWGWLFSDGGSSTIQNPSRTYTAEGSYYVTLTATDNANQVCARTKGPLIIQKPIPKWREIAPK